MQLHSCTCGCKAVLNKSQILSNNSCDIACALLKFKPGVSVKSHTGVSGRRKGNSQIHLQLSGSNSTTDWSADVKACGSIQVCNMLPPRSSLPPTASFLCTLITDALVCSWARRALLASLQTWKPPIFCTFFPDKISHIHACIPEAA